MGDGASGFEDTNPDDPNQGPNDDMDDASARNIERLLRKAELEIAKDGTSAEIDRLVAALTRTEDDDRD